MTRTFRKQLPDTLPGFFAAEAAGLRWLAEAPGGPPLPEVRAVTERAITLAWVETTAPTTRAADDFGRALAAMHRAGAPRYGADWAGFIGPLPLDNSPLPSAGRTSPDWAGWYAERRVLPYARRARDLGVLDHVEVRQVERACTRLPGLAEPPARLHGDLWSGNVLWGADGRVWLVDPAAHGGHRETDLAMLALFGLPHLDRVIAAYDEAWPLVVGWRDRVGLHQLHPLLVHAVLFGRSYAERAVAVARAVARGA